MSHSLRDPFMIGLVKTIRKVSMDIRRQEQSDPSHVKALADLVKAYAQMKDAEKPEKTEWNYEEDGDPNHAESLERGAIERSKRYRRERDDKPCILRRIKGKE